MLNYRYRKYILLGCKVLIVLIVLFSSISYCSGTTGGDPGGTGDGQNEILGCGGFVRSQYKLDFDKIEIKLFTKQGSLRMKTECAPTGYYFIPLESKGDYILRISPPEGWVFEPSEYGIQFDGKTDNCSKGLDINFDFKGFSVYGTVVTKGFKVGPSGVKLSLFGPSDLKLNTETGKDGSFSFLSIPPGTYSLRTEPDPHFVFDKKELSFEIKNKNVHVENEITVIGYKVSGEVKSDSKPVEGVYFLLYAQDKTLNVNIPNCNTKLDGIEAPTNIQGKFLCYQRSDNSGLYNFESLLPGKYTISALYRGKNIVYNMNPEKIEFDLQHQPLHLEKTFEVEGFTIQGRVKGLPGANILVNGKVVATSGHDGIFTIPKMKQGTYEFEVIAEKFQFDKHVLTITPSNPIIQDFVPSRFLTCGHIKIKPTKSQISPLTIAFQKTGGDQIVHREKVLDPSNLCVFLPEGKYEAWVEIENGVSKYFIPDRQDIQIPGATFYFQEFTGSISGTIDCKNCENIKIRATRKTDQVTYDQTLASTERQFTFEELESGEYKVEIINVKYCWEKESYDKVELKSTNVNNIQFIQSGYAVEIQSSHETNIKLTESPSTQDKSKTTFQQQNFKIEPKMVKKICLPSGEFKIEPLSTCHVFDKSSYSIKTGIDMKVNLIAIKHKFTGKIQGPGKISDLQIKKDGNVFAPSPSSTSDLEYIKEKAINNQQFEYEISMLGLTNKNTILEFHSYGHIFEPNTVEISSLQNCAENLFNVVAKKSHVIKGKLSPPLENVEIRIDLVGDPDATTYVFTNDKGDYIAGPFIHNSGFKVTPFSPGYTFKPDPKDEYSFTVLQLAKITIKITENNGNPLSSVLLSISGPNSYRQNKMTDSNGEMLFADLQPGPYYLKALLKEFQFEPSAINIDLKEQEAREYKITARRESFSVYGQLTSYSGDIMPNLLVSAKGIDNCTEYGEEGMSDDLGNFRIWALKSFCTYELTIVKTEENVMRVERTIPEVLPLKIGSGDIQNVSLIVVLPIRRIDISLRCLTNNEKSLDSLKALVYSTKSEVPLHSMPFNGISYIILPPIAKDNSEYFISFESSLNKYQYVYQLPKPINFTASKAYAHFTVQFNIEPAQVDQEVGRNSYIAFALILCVTLVIANFEKISEIVKTLVENYSNSYSILQSKKVKSKTK